MRVALVLHALFICKGKSDIMAAALEGILLIIFIGLWASASHNLSEERSNSKRLEDENKALKEARNDNSQSILSYQEQKQRDLKAAIRYCLTIHKKRASSNAVDDVLDYLYYVGDIKTVEDFFKYDFDYILKVMRYAKKGLLDYYTDSDGRLFRLDAKKNKIYLTPEEAKQIGNKDYTFIFNSQK